MLSKLNAAAACANVPYLAYAHGIRISRILHTETQDGKSVLDAHFARATQLIMGWVRAGTY